MIALPLSDHTELKRSVQDPTAEEISARAKDLGLVTLPVNDYTELKRSAEDPTAEEISARATSLGMIALPLSDHSELTRALNEPTAEEMSEKATSLGMIALSLSDYAELKRSAHEPTAEDVSKKAAGLGLVTLPEGDHTELTRALADPTAEEISKKAFVLGLVTLPIAALNELKRSAEKPTAEEVARNASSLGMIALPLDDHSELTRAIHEPTVEEISRKADMLGLATLTAADFAELNRSANEPTAEEITEKATDLGMITLLFEDHVERNRLAHNPTIEEISQKANSRGLVTIPSVEHADLLRALQEPTVEEISKLATSAGLVVLAADEYSKLRCAISYPSVEEYMGKAESSGLITLPSTDFAKLKKQAESPNEEDVLASAQRLGLAVLSKGDLSALNYKALHPDMVVINRCVEEAHAIMLSREQYDTLVRQVDKPLNSEELAVIARNMGFVLVSQPVYDDLVQRREPKTIYDTDQAIYFIRQSGYVVLTDDEYRSTCHESRWNAGNIEQLAREFGFTTLPLDTYNDLLYRSGEQKASFADENRDTMGELGVGERVVLSERDVGDVSASTNSLRYSSARLNRGAKNTIPVTMAIPPCATAEVGVVESTLDILDDSESTHVHNRPSRAQSSGSLQTRIDKRSISGSSGGTANLNPTIQRLPMSPTVNSLISGGTVGSNASFSDKHMVQIMTQIVVGEYLYKYTTRRIGMSGISDNRHQRYFWVHPYTVTLYWGHENPAGENKSNAKIKSAPILAVQSVEDNNPLPPGLFAKSLLITTPDRKMRVTCLNRHRHNIWYAGLVYLVRRNLDGLDDELEPEADIDEYVSDARFEAERARAASYRKDSIRQTHRLPSIRSLSAKRSDSTRSHQIIPKMPSTPGMNTYYNK
ncbi:hypothetical protein NADFUDRAFT_53698 [Nadsonia fulvescens var. elongata DSM 6958]|uniref:Pleckstrin homology domain-containing protein n=1 Tax=Nadsonia fulvescens var. elongata DSM 6958 TaxID=857566 RepID=A0A1E3PCE1_9ASCO|nr:hypothetical protein NADFUDRAFT_53698 [Nadsonia fulvescens var. elongata DSM 6958]